jgi:hypothetical protein
MKKIATLALAACVVCSSAPAFAESQHQGATHTKGTQQGKMHTKSTQQGKMHTKSTRGGGTRTKAANQPGMPKTGLGGASEVEE